ncbi:flavodoxin family protein [Thalassotalea ganghwensis]
MKKLVLFSSANKQGNTAQLIHRLTENQSLEVIDIDELNISPYNYQNDYPKDDFYSLVDKIVAADKLIFASPVYWHAPTAGIKTLIDRITELTDVSELKPMARALADKKALVVTTSASEEISDIFDGFFKRFFDYFNMDYIAKLHVCCRNGFDVDNNALIHFNQLLNR